MSPSKRSQPKRIVVTGGAGFIGSNVVDHLAAGGHTVFAVDDMSRGREANLSRAVDSAAVHLEKLDVRARSGTIQDPPVSSGNGRRPNLGKIPRPGTRNATPGPKVPATQQEIGPTEDAALGPWPGPITPIASEADPRAAGWP